MKAMILAAGLGTRLRPFTLHHPKALVPVGGVPMLERVINRLIEQGFDRITINVYHFADQVRRFISSRRWGIEIHISDESEALLDTGGALLHAAPILCADAEPVLVHNVDILSDAPLTELMKTHMAGGAQATLLTSGRDSSRRLVFKSNGRLRAWHNLHTDQWRPGDFELQVGMTQEAFSGIHVISPSLIEQMRSYSTSGVFSIIDFYLDMAFRGEDIRHYFAGDMHLIDIGKPDTLRQARDILG